MPPSGRPEPVVTPAPVPVAAHGIPEVMAVRYESGSLEIVLRFADAEDTSVHFEAPRGFRVLDEGDLLEFWAPETRAEGWLWSVEDGGWLSQESHRSGFISCLGDRCREFLVAGQNECVSVITDGEPKLRVTASQSGPPPRLV